LLGLSLRFGEKLLVQVPQVSQRHGRELSPLSKHLLLERFQFLGLLREQRAIDFTVNQGAA